LINNRQNGRRRGRGGGPRSPNQSPNPGNNRPENRSRGNASQLLEKYKSLARDAQLQGDRVQSEYYLQFAEHYFRVLNESRVRFEEQRRQRDDYGPDEDEDQDEAAHAAGDRDQAEESYEREERDERPDRGDRGRRDYRDERNGERRPDRQRAHPEVRPVGRDEEDRDERISLEVLPPAISVDSDAPAKPPRVRRPRRPSAEPGDTDIAPAA